MITGMPTAFRSTTGASTSESKNIQIVDHHVVDHVDIQAARRENAKPVDFEKHRPQDDFLRGHDRRD